MSEQKQFKFKGEYPNQTLVKYYGASDDIVKAVVSPQKHVVTVPQGVTAIGSRAFALSNATKVILPEGLQSVGNCAFMASLTLSDVNLPSTVTSIKKYAFSATALGKITLPQGLKTVGNGAFDNCDLQTVIIPSTVTSIGDEAFAGCKRLKKIYIPSTVKTVGLNAFKGCNSLTIYLSGDKPARWQDKFVTETVREYNDGYAFDFHRGGVSGGWYETVERTTATSFNPDKCPVVTNVTLADFKKAK